FFILALTDTRNRSRPNGTSFAPFIGLTVAVIIAVVAPLTQAGLNPARDFAPRLFSYFVGWGDIAIPGPRGGFLTVYIIAPILGGTLTFLGRGRFPRAPDGEITIHHDRRLSWRRQNDRDPPPRLLPSSERAARGAHHQRPEHRSRRHGASSSARALRRRDRGRMLLLQIRLARRGSARAVDLELARRVPRRARRKLHRSSRDRRLPFEAALWR